MKRKICLVLLVMVTLWWAGISLAAVPGTLSYQGKLTNSSGSPVNGTVSIVFTIYNVVTGGTALWTETQSSVSVSSGIFTVTLGSVTPIPSTVFSNTDLYLGIKVGADSEMTPRQKLNSVPFAIKAGTAESVINSSITAASIVDGSIQVADLDTTSVDSRYVKKSGDTMTGALVLPTNGLTVGTDQFAISSGKVGIGTTSPENALTIQGNDTAIQIGDQNGTISNIATGIQFMDTGNKNVGLRFDGTKLIYESASATGQPSTWYGGVSADFIVRNGNVGIGTTSPEYPLHIDKSFAGGLVGFEVRNSNTSNAGSNSMLKARTELGGGDSILSLGLQGFGNWILQADRSDSGKLKIGTTALDNLDSGNTLLTINTDGNVGIGTATPSYKLHVNGTVAGTSWTNLSSREFKEDINVVGESEHPMMLAKLMDMDLTRYRYKKEYGGDDEAKIGFIAEEMPKEVLSKDGKGVDVYELLAFTIGAMKAQQKEIDNVKMLKAENEVLKSQIAKLMALICQDHQDAEICR